MGESVVMGLFQRAGVGRSQATNFIGTVAIAIASLWAAPGLAQTRLPNSDVLTFQTSGGARCANIGDWYTTNGNARQTGGGVQTDPTALCLPTDPGANRTTNPTRDRLHTFVINVTAADLAAAGGQITISIDDAGSGGNLDELDGGAIPNPAAPPGSAPPPLPPGAIPDPTLFRLRAFNGGILDVQTLDPLANPADLGRTLTFSQPITQPGTYFVDSITGESPITGVIDPFNPARNNDDNGFRILISGSLNILVGQFQGTFQNSQTVATNFNFFFLVGPGSTNLYLRNFDFDSDGDLAYTSPTGRITPGTVSGQAAWNGGGLNNGGDSVAINGDAESGLWQVQINNYGSSFTNQSALEVVLGTPNDGPGRNIIPLLVLDTPPTRAGNFNLTQPSPAARPTQVGQTVCQPFTVNNLFLTTDIINLSTTGTSSGFVVEFRDESGSVALTDTDGDGQVDTGILQPFNGSRTVTLCVTPQAGATGQDETQVVATSFLDRRIRQQALRTNRISPEQANPLPIRLRLVTTLPGAESPSVSGANLLVVKRITTIARNGVPLPGVNFSTVIDDPSSQDDNAPGWSQVPLTGIVSLTSVFVQPGDEITYTVYYLSNGTAPVLDAFLCDLIPSGTTFIPGTLEISTANTPLRSGGTFFTPLAPLPSENACAIQTNPNGAAIADLGTVSNAPGQNFGFLRFRVRVN